MFEKLNHLNMDCGEDFGVSGKITDFKNLEDFEKLANKYLEDFNKRNETDLLYTGFSTRIAVYLTDDGEVEHGFGGFVIGIDVEDEYVDHAEAHFFANFQ